MVKMKVIHSISINCILLLLCAFFVCDARLDFWRASNQKNNEKKVHDLNPNKLSPVIFIPGDGGNQMEAKLNKPSTVHYLCDKTTADFFNIWLNPKLLVPVVIDCWIDNVKLIYDNKTRTTQDMPGVTIRIPGFGRSDVVEWLDPSITRSLAGAYFKDIANALVAKGYDRNVTLRGAPYDFRKAPNENQQWFIDMKQLVEETFEMSGQQRITLIVHSMGGPMSLVFLQKQTQAWKDKYIKQVVSLAGAWAGSAKAIKVFAIGDDLGSFALKGSVLRPEQITSPSLAWLMPSPYFWKPDDVLVNTREKVYKMSNINEFFDDIGYPAGWEMRKDTLPYTDFTAPGVELHCLYGEGFPTVERLNYNKGDLKTTPTLVTGDGDGTVNARSLKSCEHWSGTKAQGEKTIHSVELPGADHMGILSDKRVVQYVLQLLVGDKAFEGIPGCGGNKLQARLNKAYVPHWFCSEHSDYFDLWLDPFQLLPERIDCWVGNMKLSYDNVSRKTNNTPGVEIQLPEWGKTDELEWVDSTPIVDRYDFGAYFYHIAQALVNRGYIRGTTMFGAPYDFRKGPNENKDWFKRLQSLVEYAYNMNEQIPVTIIIHSMGGKMILLFLQQMSQEWKDQYVKQAITLSVPWGGSVQSLQAISVGYDFGATVVQNDKMKQVQETCPSVVWLMPSPTFWKQNEVLATIGKTNYTLKNIDQFFIDIGNPNAVEMRKDLAGFDNYTAPGIEMHCLFGKNVGDTVDRLDFGPVYNTKPKFVNGDGGQGNHGIFEQEFPGVEHYNMLSDPGSINYITLHYITHWLFRLSTSGSEQCVPNSNQNQDLNLRILSPVILVPGCGGNKLRARLFKENVPHFFCSKHSDWYDIWLNPGQLLPFFIDCWVENIKLYYNYVSRTTFNVPGVDLEAPDFGRTDAVEDIDTTVISHVHSFGAYYRPIVDALVKRGYVRHRSIFGAPYDFRKGPNETNDWLMKLKNLAECAYRTNSNAGVTFIVHSMGAKMTLYFLQTMTQEWKDQYVKQVISLSAPWGGSMKAIQAVSVGYDFGVNILQSSKLKMALQTFPSIAWMMPSSDFWPWYEVLVTMGKKKYTIQNIDQFLYDIGVPNSVEMRKDLIPYNNFTAPGVEIHCLYGNIADSIAEGLNFGADYNPKPTILNGYGDGTVNIRSLRGCGRWKYSQSHAIYQKELRNVEHFDILGNHEAINYILKKLTGHDDFPRIVELGLGSSDIMNIRLALKPNCF